MTNIENKILNLTTADNLDISLSSIHQKLARQRKAFANDIAKSITDELNRNSFMGERAYAKIVEDSSEKARGYIEGVKSFEQEYPKYGRILREIIEEKRAEKYKSLYFGMKKDKKISSNDYISVMIGTGLTEKSAINLYPVVLEISRKLKKARDDAERSVLLD